MAWDRSGRASRGNGRTIAAQRHPQSERWTPALRGQTRGTDSAQGEGSPPPLSRNVPLADDSGNGSRAAAPRDGNRSQTAVWPFAESKDLSLSRLRLPSDDFPALLRFDDGFSEGIDRHVAREKALQHRPQDQDA